MDTIILNQRIYSKMMFENIIDDLTCDLDAIIFDNKYEFKEKEIPAILMLLIVELRKLNCNMEDLVSEVSKQ